ncbi:metalloprotease [Aestuariivirga sp.]|uniref:metalloprotease n=1 Tax=Aestuariivirga sp. TaxID=2650926 RepID=UPI0039E49FF8
MYSFLTSAGPEIPLILVLLALLGLRHRVTPKVNLFIRAPLKTVFDVIDLKDGKIDRWGSTVVEAKLIDPAARIFRKTYTTTLTTGAQQKGEALFSIDERVPPTLLILRREGLEGRSTANELLVQRYTLEEEEGGTRLSMTYEWGQRPLLAQILARADLWGGIFRIKGLVETGKPDEKPYLLISAGVALGTGIISMGAFGLFLGWRAALMLLVALFVHEFGHLLAYRLMGQPWGRMIFLPFLGAVALPRLPFHSQGQSVFAALMGPGFSTILALLCLIPAMLGSEPNPYVALFGLIVVGLNIFNLLPAEPLDGGVALRSVLSRVMGSWARFGLMFVGALIGGAGLYMHQFVLVLFGGIAILANIRQRRIDVGLEQLSRLQIVITFFAYVSMTAAYMTLFKYFLAYASLLQLGS